MIALSHLPTLLNVDVDGSTTKRLGRKFPSRYVQCLPTADSFQIEVCHGMALAREKSSYALYTGITSFSFLCRQKRIVGQKVSTNCCTSALPDCFPSSSCLLLREYWNIVPSNTNVRVKK